MPTKRVMQVALITAIGWTFSSRLLVYVGARWKQEGATGLKGHAANVMVTL